MDIDLLKSAISSSEDQIHELMMMMQMDKLPDFGGPYPDHFPAMEFPGGGSSSSSGSSHCHVSIGAAAQMFDLNPHVSTSPAFMNLPSSTVSFGGGPGGVQELSEQKRNSSMAAMREMIFRIAAMQPIHIDPESVKPPKRRNVKISKDPQSVAARHRRERISERIRILQRLVPGGTKMDTASMLDEAIHYVKFLKGQVQSLERAAAGRPVGVGFPVAISNGGGYVPVAKGYQVGQNAHQQYSHDA